MSGHVTEIHEPQAGLRYRYWWTCSCGDEGGPHDSYNEAWDATVEHERRSPARVTSIQIPPEYVDGMRNIPASIARQRRRKR